MGISKFRKNLIYSIIYQIISIITPLIMTPYLSRTIGAVGNGDYNYTLAYANFFFLFAMLGVNNYGTRKIAQIKNDKVKLSKSFWEIYFLQLFLSICFSVLYILFCFLAINSEQRVLFLLQGLVVLAAATDINWFAFGVEEFKYTTIRNLVVKLITFLSIFLFVRDSSDTWKYVLIVENGVIIGLVALWPLVKKETYFYLPKYKDVIAHLKPNLILFIPVLATSIFQYTDKIMMGIFIDNNMVGHYSYAEHIVNVPLSIITAVCTVAMPRITKMISQKDDNSSEKLFERCLYITSILEIAMFFGVAAVSNRFISLYLGENFFETAKLLALLSVVIPLSGTANVIRTMLLIPNSRDKLYVLAIVIGALVNVGGNLILMPAYGARGACISTIASYAIVMIVQMIGSRKDFKYCSFLLKMIPFVFLGAIIYYLIAYIDRHMVTNQWILLLIEVAVGICVYIIGSIFILQFYSFVKRKKSGN